MKSRGKTSGEDDAYIAVHVARLPPVDVRTIGIEVADVHQVAVHGLAALLLSSPI